MSENLFLKIWSHAILFVRPPMTRIRVAMLSQKSRRRMPRPPPANRGGDRARPAGADRRGRATERARGRTSYGRARAPEGSASRARRSGPSVGLAAPAGRGRKFSSLQTIENKRNRVGIPPNNPRRFRGSRGNGGDRLAEPKGGATPRPSSASFAGNRRAAEAGRRNFPVRKPLKTLETAKESR
jgi:hypothetical protein